ncbi:hypothetical protein J6590_015878 [Homalodisca vitripennis]|nr:hypothetical protein J6590_015878 [Homalodisca vitripennis]
MRGDSRGAVLTTRTHTLSRSLTIFCPRFGLTRFVPDPVSATGATVLHLRYGATFKRKFLTL